MRTYDIPYVPNPARTNDVIPGLETMDLRTITKTYLCGKSHGKVSECMRCPAPCAYGKRALELLAQPVDVITPAQGKTLIEKAREAALQQREQMKAQETKEKEEQVVVVTSSGRQYLNGWYEMAFNTEDPVQWVMDTFNMTANKAKHKIYTYQKRHPELNKKKSKEPVKETPVMKQTIEPAAVPPEAIEPKAEPKEEATPISLLENKINELMNQQEEYKKQMDHYEKLYKETKTKVDALYEALNILNE